jgi:hypothetical protein
VIPNRTWRGWAVGTVLAADVVVLLVAGASLPSFLAFLVGPLAVGTVWALRRPSGWGPLVLLVLQVTGLVVPRVQPATVVDWVLTAGSAAAVVATHLALTLMGSWPRRADLPPATARRWLMQGAALVWVGIAAAGAGLLATATPQGWVAWVSALALALVAGLAWQLRGATRRG